MDQMAYQAKHLPLLENQANYWSFQQEIDFLATKNGWKIQGLRCREDEKNWGICQSFLVATGPSQYFWPKKSYPKSEGF